MPACTILTGEQVRQNRHRKEETQNPNITKRLLQLIPAGKGKICFHQTEWHWDLSVTLKAKPDAQEKLFNTKQSLCFCLLVFVHFLFICHDSYCFMLFVLKFLFWFGCFLRPWETEKKTWILMGRQIARSLRVGWLENNQNIFYKKIIKQIFKRLHFRALGDKGHVH